MINKIINYFHIIHNLYIKEKVFLRKKTYSQEKSDIIIDKFFKEKKNGFFVDVGCFHPTRMNNTFLLYQRGWRGINIDISKFSIDLFNFKRPYDINIQAAVSGKNEIKNLYYQKNFSLISTLDKDLASRRFQGKIKEKKIECFTLNYLIETSKYQNDKIDFLSIDTEGMDEIILETLDFEKYYPRLICAEDSVMNRNYKDTNLYKILKPKGYKHLWSSYVNHLFFFE